MNVYLFRIKRMESVDWIKECIYNGLDAWMIKHE